MRAQIVVGMLLFAAPAVAGSLEMGGEFVLNAPADKLLSQWLTDHPGTNELQNRDEQWWLDAVVHVDGKRIHLFEQSVGDDAAIAHRRQFLNYLSENARRGNAFLVQMDSGIASWSWNVVNGRVVPDKKGKSQKLDPKSPAGVNFRQQRERQRQQLGARTPPEAFREFLIRDAKTLTFALLEGMDAATRLATAQAIHESAARGGDFLKIDGPAFPTPPPSEGTVFVERLEATDFPAQEAILRATRAKGALILVGTDNLSAAKAAGKLRADLHARLREKSIDVRTTHP